MAVTLKGEGFRITAYSDEEQSVSQSGSPPGSSTSGPSNEVNSAWSCL